MAFSDWVSDGHANPAPTYGERPAWLGGHQDPENPPDKDFETVVVDKAVDDAKPVRAETSPLDDEKESASGKFKKLILFAISTLFLAFFIYASVMEKMQNGTRLQYEIFNGASAGIPFLFLVHWMICFPEKLIYLASVGMAAWGTVLMVMICLDWKDLPKDGDDRTDTIYAMAIIAASIFSSLYHPCVMRCCIKKRGD